MSGDVIDGEKLGAGARCLHEVGDSPASGIGAEGVERVGAREPQDVELAVPVGGTQAAYEAARVLGDQGKHRVLVLPERRKAVGRYLREEDVGHAVVRHGPILASATQPRPTEPPAMPAMWMSCRGRGRSHRRAAVPAAEVGSFSGSIRSMSEPTQKYSITMPRDVAEAARTRSSPSGLSAYVAAAVARQIERDNLNDLIAVAEAEHGPVSDEEVQAKRDTLLRAREQQTPGRGAA